MTFEKLWFSRGGNLIEKSNVVETLFMYSKLFVCIWWSHVYVCFGEIMRFSRVSDDSGKIQQVWKLENSGFLQVQSIAGWCAIDCSGFENVILSLSQQAIDCYMMQIDCLALKM